MAIISALEKWLEKMVEGFFSRSFKGQIQPIEIGKKLVKEMDDKKTISISKVYVPDNYTVFLGQEDWGKIKTFSGALAEDLADYLLKQGLKQHYIFLHQPKVLLQVEENLLVGQMRVESNFAEEGTDTLLDDLTDTKIEPVAQTTQIFSAKKLSLKSYGQVMVLEGLDKGKSFSITEEETILGRKSSNHIFLNDSNVSRFHAKIICNNSGCWLHDLHSTNGTWLNGQKITEIKLKDQDILEIGTTILMFKVV